MGLNKEANTSTTSSKDNGDDGAEEVSSEKEESQIDHPFIGKRVKVVQGNYKGLTTVITSIRTRGWWTVEHPDIDGVIHSGRCRLLDTVDEDEMREYYEKRGMKYRRTNSFRPTRRKEVPDVGPSLANSQHAATMIKGAAEAEGGVAFRTLQTLEKGLGANEEKPEKEESRPEETGDTTQNNKRKFDASAPLRETEGRVRMSDLIDAASNSKARRLYCDDVSRLHLQQQKASRHVVLPPIVLKPAGDDGAIPERLQSLPRTMAVEIFDRKSGKILRGANAVQIRDLAKVLRDHPEYEAIVPPSEFISSDRREPPSYREGRSAPSIRVSATIVPQLAHQSLKEGAAVKVTGGQYRGFSGTIRHRLPGSWCLIDGIAKAGGTAIPVIVSASHLAVVQMDVAKKTRVAGIKAHLPDCNDEGPSVKETFQSCLSDITGNRIGTLNQQVLALAKDQCQLEDQLRRTLDSSSVTMNPEDLARERHRLQKRLDYVKSCRQQAEKEVNVAQSTARAHQRHLASES